MRQQEEQLHLIMDESDAPYRDDEYTWTLADDLRLIRFAKEHGLEFMPDSDLGKLSQAMDASRNQD
ncbi:hypothetical protein AALC17_10180 [Oscillospiraceae bacterium 38-13]